MPDYDVYKKNGEWVGKRSEGTRSSVKSATQASAYDATKAIASRNGGGEISVHGRDGQIREKNTIKPARDPRNSKG
jgi:hypothetical protein